MPERYDDQVTDIIKRLLDRFEDFSKEVTTSTSDNQSQLNDLLKGVERAHSELSRVASDIEDIRRIVIGQDGGNGLRSEVRELTRRVDDNAKKIDQAARQETERNKFVAEWGWKVVVFIVGLVIGLPGLIQSLRDLLT